MTFSKAHKGVKKLFVAGILSLAGSVCMWIAVFTGLLGITSVLQGDIGGFFSGGFITLFLLLAGLLLPIIAYILKLVGLGQAREEEPLFQQGFLFAVLAMIFIILETIFSALNIGGSVIEGIVQTVYSTLDVVVAVIAVYSIRNLAEKLEDFKMVKSGSSLVKYITIFYAASLFVTLISVLFGSNLLIMLLMGILSLITSVLNLIAYIIYLVYLGRAMKMLRNGEVKPTPDPVISIAAAAAAAAE